MAEQRWDLSALRRSFRNRPDADAHGLLRSVDRSLRIVSYHVFEARDAVGETSAADETASLKAFEALMGQSDEQEQHDRAMLISQAHTVAGIHAIRNVADIFSQLVNVLVLDSSIAVEDCDIYWVERTLRAQHAGGELASELERLLTMHWYKYVSAYTNTSKHRRLIDHSFHVSFEEGVFGVRIGHFDYLPKRPKDAPWQRFRSYPVREALAGVLDVKNQIVRCGIALNGLVLPRTPCL